MKNKKEKKILILVGSGDVESYSLGLGNAIAKELKKMNAESEILNLIEYGLPLYNRLIERSRAYNIKTKMFLEKSYQADAFIWITPIYHNSFSGILKNALDWQHTEFPGKVVGFASNGGNRSPQAADQLMLVARAQHLLSTRVRVCTQESDYDADRNLTDQKIKKRVEDFCQEILKLTMGHIE